jgi:hypothetical protein
LRPWPHLTMLLLVALCASNFSCGWSKKPARTTNRTPPPPRPATKNKAAAKPKPAGGRQEQRATREPPKAAENGPAPPLGQMLSQEERTELTRSLDRNLSDARQAMSRLSGHALTSEQFQSLNLVQSLLVQADKARHTDLAMAAELARRAGLLARDLLTSVR